MFIFYDLRKFLWLLSLIILLINGILKFKWVLNFRKLLNVLRMIFMDIGNFRKWDLKRLIYFDRRMINVR